jgi:hypothetical protein
VRQPSLGGIITVGKGDNSPEFSLGQAERKSAYMRFMLTYRISPEKGNALAREENLRQTVQAIVEQINPEAAYFTPMEGARGGYLVVNLDDASQIAAMAEPLFIGLDATVQIHPVMTGEDLDKATPALEQAVQRYR